MNDAASTIRVVVVEDQPAVLKNQLKILQEAPGIEVMGTALSGEAALSLLEKERPDVILQDLGLPRMSGIDVTREVKRRWPAVEVLVFTIFGRAAITDRSGNAFAFLFRDFQKLLFILRLRLRAPELDHGMRLFF